MISLAYQYSGIYTTHQSSLFNKSRISDAIDETQEQRELEQIIPDYVKLARFLVSEIDTTPVKQALAEALVCFSKKIGAKIIAEGLERPEELAYFASIGVEYGQGYLMAHPSFIPSTNRSYALPGLFRVTTRKSKRIHCRLSSNAL